MLEMAGYFLQILLVASVRGLLRVCGATVQMKTLLNLCWKGITARMVGLNPVWRVASNGSNPWHMNLQVDYSVRVQFLCSLRVIKWGLISWKLKVSGLLTSTKWFMLLLKLLVSGRFIMLGPTLGRVCLTDPLMKRSGTGQRMSKTLGHAYHF